MMEMETHQNKLVLIHQTFFDLLVKIGVSAQILMSLKHPWFTCLHFTESSHIKVLQESGSD